MFSEAGENPPLFYLKISAKNQVIRDDMGDGG